MNYVVIDLEMCNVSKGLRTKEYKWTNETIQIGAVLLNEHYEIVSKFMTYVAPEYGRLTSTIIELTGITNNNLVGAPTMDEALKKLTDWMPADCSIVAWSENDEIQIMREIQGKNIDFPGIEKLFVEWDDCQVTFSEIIGRDRVYNLKEALNLANIDYDENIHDGLVDASNTALLYKKMKTEDEFSFNEYYKQLDDGCDNVLSASMASLFANLKLA